MINKQNLLPNGWFWSSDKDSEELLSELQKELHPLHLLNGKKIKVVAHRNGANDDILCELFDLPGFYYIIHLTWIGKTEIDGNHPSVLFSGSLSELFDYEKLFSIN